MNKTRRTEKRVAGWLRDDVLQNQILCRDGNSLKSGNFREHDDSDVDFKFQGTWW